MSKHETKKNELFFFIHIFLFSPHMRHSATDISSSPSHRQPYVILFPLLPAHPEGLRFNSPASLACPLLPGPVAIRPSPSAQRVVSHPGHVGTASGFGIPVLRVDASFLWKGKCKIYVLHALGQYDYSYPTLLHTTPSYLTHRPPPEVLAVVLIDLSPLRLCVWSWSWFFFCVLSN